MPQIHILDSETIDKIAAGEVVERPSSVVKELVENAIDAGADAITVEAKEGGITFLRITDNGCGMEAKQIRTAFLRHATSKINHAEDLHKLSSLGFRGEALSSIAAVSQVEVITKTADSFMGVRFLIEGSVEKAIEEIGASNGTTFFIRNLFYNTPVRKKFLKQPAIEGGYITDLMEHLALSRPDISFRFLLGGQLKFHTSGNGNLKEVIYRIYGRETAAELIPIQESREGIQVEGYLGKPSLVRSNRNMEVYFLNGRFIKSQLIAHAIEGGYKEYLMQHKFPFCILSIRMEKEMVDINVHPTKMDVRFADEPAFGNLLSSMIRDVLHKQEMIPTTDFKNTKKEFATKSESINLYKAAEEAVSYNKKLELKGTEQEDTRQENIGQKNAKQESIKQESIKQENSQKVSQENFQEAKVFSETFQRAEEFQQEELVSSIQIPVQLNLLEEKILSAENRSKFKIIGQVFDTYWLIQVQEKLLIIDQHAAHEKVKYERLIKQYTNKKVLSQILLPPIIVSLTGQEETILKENFSIFQELGFEIESFGGNEYALRSVPIDLYGCKEKEMFLEVLDGLNDFFLKNNKKIEEKIASMACKAAVKGKYFLSIEEVNKLIDELLTLDNPYYCPHGRPTMIAITKKEMEKKFKRIL